MNQAQKRTIIHILAGCLMVLCMMIYMPGKPSTAYAADLFVQKHSDMIGQGGFIYFIRTHAYEDGPEATIYRKKVTSGETASVVGEPNGIVDLVVSGQYLYYTTSDDANNWIIRMCRLDGEDVRTVCEGRVCYADSMYVYGIRYVDGAKPQLFCISFSDEEELTIMTAKSGQTMEYVGNAGNEDYFYIYDGKTDKITLYHLNEESKKLVRIATEGRVAKDSNGAMLVSDIRRLNGELYYNYGSYEGSGGFWYGTIKKMTETGKKKVVAKTVGDDRIIAGSKELYFGTPNGNTYKYDLKTGTKKKYSLAFEKDISYTILGDKTYMADTSNKKKISISRFHSGTKRGALTKNFITIPFQQKKNVSYSVDVKQIGIYYIACVTGIDYTDPKYGWRGKLTSIDWYITDGAGKVLGSFK